MDKVITGKDLAARDGCRDHLAWIGKLSEHMRRRNQLDTPFTGKVSGEAVEARIDAGRWMADCPVCGGVEYVDPDEKVFYCFQCGNHEVRGDGRPVVFPEAREQIEKLVMTRPVMKLRGRTAIEREMQAVPAVAGLGRFWQPGTSAKDLAAENEQGMKSRGGR